MPVHKTRRRKPGRPRKLGPRRRPVRRRRLVNQPGGQLGFLVKALAPLVLGELAKPLIRKGIKGFRGLTGLGLHPAGAGLKLAGQGHPRVRRRGRKPGPKPGRVHILPHPLPPALMRSLLR